MRFACNAAVERGVSIGAHVGYRDRVGFGRRELTVSAAIVRDDVAEQILVLQEHAAVAGGRVVYVKPHGALYHRASVDAEVAEAIVGSAGGLAMLAFPGSRLIACAQAAGLQIVPEAFADRGYTAAGSLVERGEPGDLLDEDDASAQAVSLAREAVVTTRDGQRAVVEAKSICLHGDTPGALRIALRVRAALEHAGVVVRAFA
jgi:UPF0271 protein